MERRRARDGEPTPGFGSACLSLGPVCRAPGKGCAQQSDLEIRREETQKAERTPGGTSREGVLLRHRKTGESRGGAGPSHRRATRIGAAPAKQASGFLPGQLGRLLWDCSSCEVSDTSLGVGVDKITKCCRSTTATWTSPLYSVMEVLVLVLGDGIRQRQHACCPAQSALHDDCV